MSAVSIQELVLRGESEGVAVGTQLRAVLDVLGEPTDRSQIKPDILKYGPLEVTFINDRLALISYHARHPGGVSLKDVRVIADMPESLDTFERLLRRVGVEFVRDEALSYDNQRAIRVVGRSQAILIFENGALRSVHVGG